MSDLKELIRERIKSDLEAIEEELRNNLNPYYDLVESIAGHILYAGGKRLRPLLMVLSARICGYTGSYDKQFSVLFEYLHAATLLHDDLVDDAETRRGKPVAHKEYGNPEAVLTGDFLLARSLSLAAATGIPELISVIASITEDMSQGEIRQLRNKGRLDLTEAEYMDVIERKTATLIRGACRSGALIAGANSDREKALTSYGYSIGIAFQMADDLLDYTSDAETLGKDPGADLREGKLTLPVIHALEQASPEDRIEMEAIISNTEFSHDEFIRLKELLETYNGMAYTYQKAVDHISTAKQAVSIFDPSPTRDLLEMIADYALVRKA